MIMSIIYHIIIGLIGGVLFGLAVMGIMMWASKNDFDGYS